MLYSFLSTFFSCPPFLFIPVILSAVWVREIKQIEGVGAEIRVSNLRFNGQTPLKFTHAVYKYSDLTGDRCRLGWYSRSCQFIKVTFPRTRWNLADFLLIQEQVNSVLIAPRYVCQNSYICFYFYTIWLLTLSDYPFMRPWDKNLVVMPLLRCKQRISVNFNKTRPHYDISLSLVLYS